MTTTQATDALEAAGYTTKTWENGIETRVYVRKGSRDLGYIHADSLDDIDHATRHCDRKGHLRIILRGAAS